MLGGFSIYRRDDGATIKTTRSVARPPGTGRELRS
jgi:hypothetical protein